MTSPVTGPATSPGTGASSPGELADRVAEVVLSVPGVAALHGGSFGEIGTYLRGRRVDGVRLTDDAAEVHLAVTMGSDVPAVATAVREAVADLVGGPVHVVVEDVLPSGEGRD